MPVGFEGLEVTRSNHADSALRHTEVAEAGLPEQRPDGAEVPAAQHRARIGDDPQLLRGDRVALPVGRAAGQPDVTNAEHIVGSVHADSDSRPPIVFISRVAAVACRSTVQCSTPGISMSTDCGLTHVTSISHWAVSFGVAELKYRAQLCWPGVVA
jgi:hypothetical protein